MGLESKHASVGLMVLMIAGMAASFSTSSGVRWKEWALLGVGPPVSAVILWLSLRLAGVDLGPPELSREQHVAEMIKALPALIINGFGQFWRDPRYGVPALFMFVAMGSMISHLATGTNVRGAGLLLLALGNLLRAAFSVAGITQIDDQGDPVMDVSMACCAIACYWTKYLRDQRIVFYIACAQLLVGIQVQPCFSQGLFWKVLFPVMVCFLCYMILLCVRRLRNLPPALGAVKFIRLGFIRGDARCSGPILRCQDMPAAAFGDVRKAMRLISASHRWLHRDTCDVRTPAFPMGLRLGTMRRELNAHFSPTRAEEPSFARRVRHALGRRAVGGWDAIVFFDFAGVPQAPRSEEDERVFRQCLPHMGMLYSMFPTMILHEVLPGCHGYMDSGWCFCELQTARLGDQLAEYSSGALGALGVAPGDPLMGAGAASSVPEPQADPNSPEENVLGAFISEVDAALEHKNFFFPDDAVAVRGIVHAYALKRMLLDAIADGDAEKLRSVVGRLQTQGLAQSVLDQPVNVALETPLHMAVRKADAMAAKVLLDNGADPTRSNLRGDTPAQCFMWPRVSGAAQLARAAPRPTQAAGDGVGRACAHNGAPQSQSDSGAQEPCAP